MLKATIAAEWLKMKRNPVWLSFILLPILPAIMGTFNYLQNQAVLQNYWYSLWTQHTLFNCYFFLPALIGVYCSYLYRMEHTNHNWNAAMTAPVRISYLYFAKLFTASVMVCLTMVWIGVLFIASGWLAGVSGSVPLDLLGWLVRGAIAGIVICAIQLILSLIIRSFAVPVGIALIGGFSGVAFLAQGLGAYYPYSLLALGMKATNPEGAMPISGTTFILHCLLFILACWLFASLWLKKRDVIAG